MSKAIVQIDDLGPAKWFDKTQEENAYVVSVQKHGDTVARIREPIRAEDIDKEVLALSEGCSEIYQTLPNGEERRVLV